MNDNNAPKDLPGALARMRDIENSLRNTNHDQDNTESEAQAELMDELMTLDMGMQPLRRTMSKKANLDLDDQPPAV